MRARGRGAVVWPAPAEHPRLLQRNDPFGVNHWVGGAVGVVRDEKGGVPKWDELLKCKCDIKLGKFPSPAGDGQGHYIVDLLKRVTRVSVETMKIVNALPALNERKAVG